MSTPVVQYGYADGSANTIRPTSVTYPDGREIAYEYGTEDGADDLLSRVASIEEDAAPLADYTYYGAGQFCKTDYAEPAATLDLTYQGTSLDPYGGCLDRFGRVIQAPWIKSSAPIAGATYEYDRSSNRTQMQPLGYTATNDLQRYSYDGVNRLTRSIRGPNDGLKAQEAWDLDATGNWRQYDVLNVDDPTQNLAQARLANQANEITDVSRRYGANWPTPAYDRAGNTTSFPRPLVPTSAGLGTYDAWNRLVATNTGTSVSYAYDALNRRTTLNTGGVVRHFYYSSQWQILEERLDDATTADRQFVWGLRYIDDQICRDQTTGSLLLEGGYAQSPVGIAGIGSGWTASGMFKVASPSVGNGGLIGQLKTGSGGADAAMWLQYGGGGTVAVGADGDLQGWYGSGLNDGQWHHVVGRLDDSGNLSLWIDGVQAFESDSNANVTGNDVRIGQFEGTGEAFLGQMKDVRGWSEALSDAQIEAVYETDTGTGSGSFPSPVFYYPFAENADDYSGHGNDAALAGAATVAKRYYALQDANWNTIALTNTSGTVQQRYRYLAYGTPIRLNPNGSLATGTDSILWDCLYAGYRYDRNTGLYLIRNRWLDCVTGSWLSRDPLGFSAGLNMYLYTSNRPISSLDPLGLIDPTNRSFGSDAGDGLMSNINTTVKNPGPIPPVPFGTINFVQRYCMGNGEPLDLATTGLFDTWRNDATVSPYFDDWYKRFEEMFKGDCDNPSRDYEGNDKFEVSTKSGLEGDGRRRGGSGESPLSDPIFSLGWSDIYVKYSCRMMTKCECSEETGMLTVRSWEANCWFDFSLRDKFENPIDIGGPFYSGPGADPPCTSPYKINHDWSETKEFKG